MSEEWSEWFLHDGRGCPGIAGLVLECIVRRGYDLPPATGIECEQSYSAPWLWAIIPCQYQIIRYRIRKPKGLTILVGLLENLPERETA